MGDLVRVTSGPVANRSMADDVASLFEDVSEESVADLLVEYQQARERVTQVASTLAGEQRGVLMFFIEGNARDVRYGAKAMAERLFGLEGAIKALNADFWRRALDLTDVLSCMPQARRDAWHEQIRELETPDFDEATVTATLRQLLADRRLFFAERVDGVFRALSRTHVTNAPQGFRRRMILDGVHDGYVDCTKAGHINDLRIVVAKFMGRDVPGYRASRAIVEMGMRRRGEWLTLDGGAIRIRVYKRGTAHLEVHEEMAWRLNAVLAYLHPTAIADEHRRRPAKRRARAVELFDRPLPFRVIDVLSELKPDPGGLSVKHNYTYSSLDKHIRKEVERVLALLGGTMPDTREPVFVFDYDVLDVLEEVVASGCIPDTKAHQYYPTPPSIAARVVELAEIGAEHTVLEPSAGQGALAELLPERTVCVEASRLHCVVLRSKGFGQVHEADFLKWGARRRFDRILLNPPFDQGRWRAHIERASEMLAPGGRLVAVLPASARNRDLLPGWSVTWSEPIVGEFRGTSISVVILCAEAR